MDTEQLKKNFEEQLASAEKQISELEEKPCKKQKSINSNYKVD